MKGFSEKQPQGSASDLKSFLAVMSTRRAKLFLYGFGLAFVAYTAYLAFASPGGAASPWFHNLFASAAVSTAPYRSQISDFFSSIFPNSSSPSAARSSGDVWGSTAGNGVAPEKDAILGGIGASGENRTAKEGGSVAGLKGGVDLATKNQNASGIGKNQNEKGTSSAPSGDTTKGLANERVGAPKDGVAAGDQQSVGKVGPLVNENGTVIGAGGIGVSTKSDAKEETGSKEELTLPGKNETGTGNQSLANGASTRNQTENAVGFGGNGASSPKEKKDGDLVEKKPTPESPEKGIPTKSQSQTPMDTGGNGNAVPTSKEKGATAAPQGHGALTKNQSAQAVAMSPNTSGTPASIGQKGAPLDSNRASNLKATLMKGNGSATSPSNGDENRRDDWIKAMIGCNIFEGKWVEGDTYPLYREGSCPHIDEPFDCYLNGRPDRAYQKLRWQPNACNIPRLNAIDMLERLRGKRLVFVGDSLNRNMWESLVCVLRNSIKDKTKVFEASGRHEFRTEGSYSFLFTDYNCSVEFFRSPFLVQEWEMPVSNGTTKETLRLDIIERSSPKYKDADVIIFNTGHWWTHEKTAKGRDYYQEGNHVYSELNVVDAFHKALNTWAKWVDTNVNPKKTVVFFRGYSASHFRGGQWNSGGQCHKETEPIKNEHYLSSYPPKMSILEEVIKGMKTPIVYLNITRMTDYRKDAHPSIYRKQNLTEEERMAPERFQDCSHWCLPGVPDTWNELLYAKLLTKLHQMLHNS